ncbi:hypothetical protein MOQ_001069 [Trypanosoma cruzi marinkellei]|uniref:Uncharacterized protein n=1 Tax=Trypanosoma cruzi marinkellei TaxID=85056 RepID=K2NH75_TRYCR|nr:hypothetical protein MOQ_001069 [Trypanosoma cruzi marinkellei]
MLLFFSSLFFCVCVCLHNTCSRTMMDCRGNLVSGLREVDGPRLVKYFQGTLLSKRAVSDDGVVLADASKEGSVANRRRFSDGVGRRTAGDQPVLCAFIRQVLGGVEETMSEDGDIMLDLDSLRIVMKGDSTNDGGSDVRWGEHFSKRRPLHDSTTSFYTPRRYNFGPQRSRRNTIPFSPITSSVNIPLFEQREKENARDQLLHVTTPTEDMNKENVSSVPSRARQNESTARVGRDIASLWKCIRRGRSSLRVNLPLLQKERKMNVLEKGILHMKEKDTSVSSITEGNVGVSPVVGSNKISTATSGSSSFFCKSFQELEADSQLSAPRLKGQKLREAWSRDATLPARLHGVADIEGTGSVSLSRLLTVLREHRYLDWTEEEVKRTVAALANNRHTINETSESMIQEENSETFICIKEENETFYLNSGAFFSLLRALLVL